MTESAGRETDIAATLQTARAAWAEGRADEAEMACRRVLAAWPGQADATYLLGLMAYSFGNLGLAIEHVREACRAPRAPAGYFSDFAEMCRQAGLLAEGEQAARRAVALAPGMAAAWNNLGIILQEAGQLDESRICIERALALDSENPETLNNLANTLKRLGLAAEAQTRWQAALALNPNYAEAHSNLANLLLDQGDYAGAETRARTALGLNPHLADAHINLAAVHTVRRQHAEALRTLDALLEFAPSHPRALSARALALKELDRLDAALDAARRAVFAAPQGPEAHNALGQVFQAMGQFEPALEAYDRAAALPGAAQQDAMVNRCAHLMEFGRLEAAAEAASTAAAAFPNAPGVLLAQTELRRVAPGDKLIGQMQALIARDGLSLADRTTLHFGLGKAFLDIGDSAEAFRHYHAGNSLKRSTLAYDAAENEQFMEAVAAAFPVELLAANAGAGAHGSLPVFVVGMPRSGTTLIEQILASHPAVSGAGELPRLHRLAETIEGFPSSAASLTPERLKTLGDAYLADLAPRAAGRPRAVDKMPSNFILCGLIRLALPDARIIHARRDPADTCLSCYTKLFVGEQSFAYDQAELGRFYRAYEGLMAHWRAVLPASHFLEVEYESVVADIECQARRMLDFLGLPWDGAVLNFHATQRPVRTASVGQVRQKLYRSSVGRWKAHADQLQPLLAALRQ